MEGSVTAGSKTSSTAASPARSLVRHAGAMVLLVGVLLLCVLSLLARLLLLRDWYRDHGPQRR